MNAAQQKAWSCLTEREQQSLFLQMSASKSTWEAGEILKLSHYKYIEIRERSVKFFKLFTDFFELHESIFNPNCPCERNFQDYIEGCIEKRLSRKEASIYSGDSTMQLPKVTTENILRNMKRLHESHDPWDIDTRRLILEFDRWNNSRILPALIQQPSAFKRRLNKKDKIYIKYLIRKIPAWMLRRLEQRFKYLKKRKNSERYWVTLVNRDLYPDGYKVIPVKVDLETVNEFSKCYIYVFPERELADAFGFMVANYFIKTADVKLGQKFWPEYRNCIESAVNYNQVNNIEFSVKNLDVAYNTHIPKRTSANKKKKKKKDDI